MEKLQSMVMDFVERVGAFTSAQSQVKVAARILQHLRGLLEVIVGGLGVESIAGLDAKALETAIAEQQAIVDQVTPETRQGLTEAAQALATLAASGVFDDEPELKAAALKGVEDFKKASVTVVPPVGKAARRAA